MKSKIKLIIFICIIVLVASTVTSFKLKDDHLLGNTTHYVYSGSTLVNYAVEFEPLIYDAMNNMSASSVTFSGPSWSYVGTYLGFGGAPHQDGYNEIGYAHTSNQYAGGFTVDYHSGSGTYSEFDIAINSNFIYLANFNNGGGTNAVDRATVLRHELGHAIGLDHTGVSGRLMYGTITIGDSPKYRGTDEERGIRCIYANTDCNHKEGTSTGGATEMNTYFVKCENPNEYALCWKIETDRDDYVGFNVYRKGKKDTIYHSVNNRIMFFDPEQKKYEYPIHGSLSESEYFVESVFANGVRELEKIKPHIKKIRKKGNKKNA